MKDFMKMVQDSKDDDAREEDSAEEEPERKRRSKGAAKKAAKTRKSDTAPAPSPAPSRGAKGKTDAEETQGELAKPSLQIQQCPNHFEESEDMFEIAEALEDFVVRKRSLATVLRE